VVRLPRVVGVFDAVDDRPAGEGERVLVCVRVRGDEARR
jgi:hypothetical protein